MAEGTWESEACSVPFSRVEEDEDSGLRDLGDEAEAVTGASKGCATSRLCFAHAKLVCACYGSLKH